MPLLDIKTSKKIDTHIRLEESTANLLDRYAHFAKSSADAVVNSGLEYVFAKDKDFQQYLESAPPADCPSTLRVKKPVAPIKKTGMRQAHADAAVMPK